MARIKTVEECKLCNKLAKLEERNKKFKYLEYKLWLAPLHAKLGKSLTFYELSTRTKREY